MQNALNTAVSVFLLGLHSVKQIVYFKLYTRKIGEQFTEANGTQGRERDLVRREIRWCVTVRHELYWQAALEKERRILIQRECVPEEFHSFKDDLIRQGAAIRQNSAMSV